MYPRPLDIYVHFNIFQVFWVSLLHEIIFHVLPKSFTDLSMKHYASERIGIVGLVISTASSVLASEVSFEMA